SRVRPAVPISSVSTRPRRRPPTRTSSRSSSSVASGRDLGAVAAPGSSSPGGGRRPTGRGAGPTFRRPYRFRMADGPPSRDLVIGSFTDHGPWVVEPESMTWRRDVERLRENAREEYPRWMETGRLPPLGRLVRVVARVGSALGVWAVGARRQGPPQSRRDLSRRLRIAFGHLGPTYIKLGQIISGGEGLFPAELVAEFKLLRDRVPPESFADVRRVVELELGRSL